MQVTAEQAHRAWITAERIKRLADRLIWLDPSASAWMDCWRRFRLPARCSASPPGSG
jgi:hypothetical protein